MLSYPIHPTSVTYLSGEIWCIEIFPTATQQKHSESFIFIRHLRAGEKQKTENSPEIRISNQLGIFPTLPPLLLNPGTVKMLFLDVFLYLVWNSLISNCEVGVKVFLSLLEPFPSFSVPLGNTMEKDAMRLEIYAVSLSAEREQLTSFGLPEGSAAMATDKLLVCSSF